jgi:hypothetical protein
MSRKFSVVTTFHQAGYDLYGRRMIDGFLQNWPQEITLVAYAEDCRVDQSDPRLLVKDLAATVPDLVRFKQRWINDPKATGKQAQGPIDRKGKQTGIGFKWDAVRFSHKVYSVCDCARNTDADILFWMDADTVCHGAISIADIERMVPTSADICFLGRAGKYTECGLYAMNLRSSVVQEFLSRFQWVYDHAEQGIFTMAEWHDSFVFDRVREQFALKSHDWSAGLIRGEGHPLINSEWGRWLDHLKGKRKQYGRSAKKDLLTLRPEAYWTSSA